MCWNSAWTLKAIRDFVASLACYLSAFTPAELYVLFQQNGLLEARGKGKAFVRASVASTLIPQPPEGVPVVCGALGSKVTTTVQSVLARSSR